MSKVAGLPEKEILKMADSHFSHCDGPAFEGKQCNSLCGGPTSDGNASYEWP